MIDSIIFEVACSECPYCGFVDGLDTVLELQDDHKIDCGDDHIFEFELLR